LLLAFSPLGGRRFSIKLATHRQQGLFDIHEQLSNVRAAPLAMDVRLPLAGLAMPRSRREIRRRSIAPFVLAPKHFVAVLHDQRHVRST